LQWFDDSQCASVWSALSTSMNVACTVGPMLLAATLTVLRWHAFFVLLGTYIVGYLLFVMFSKLFSACAFTAVPHSLELTSDRGGGV